MLLMSFLRIIIRTGRNYRDLETEPQYAVLAQIPEDKRMTYPNKNLVEVLALYY